MKALVLEDIGKLTYRDVPDPAVKRGEVLIRIRDCGICSSDIPRIFSTGTYHFPTIPGHEFAGEIVDCAPDVDRSLLGRHAAVFPLLPCGKCSSCIQEEYARCDNYNYFGSRCDGAFAELISVPVWNLVLVPESIPFATAALCEPVSVAKHCVDTGKITPGNTVTVVGTGTIGLSAALWAKSMGVEHVICVGTNEAKLRFAESLGIDITLNSCRQDTMEHYMDLTQGQGADVVLECVGAPAAVINAVRYAKKGGTVVLTGNPTGEVTFPKDTYWKILRSELTVKGTWNSSYKRHKNNWKETVTAMVNGSLKPAKLITHTFRLDQYEHAFATMQNCEVFSVKVMFEM